MLRIKLVKSYFGNNPRNRGTIKALGLRHVGHVVDHADTPTIRGMIHAIKHVLEVTEGPEVAKVKSVPRNNHGQKAKVRPAEAQQATAVIEKPKPAKAAPAPAATAPAEEAPKKPKATKAKAGTEATEAGVEPTAEKPKRTTKKKAEEA